MPALPWTWDTSPLPPIKPPMAGVPPEIQAALGVLSGGGAQPGSSTTTALPQQTIPLEPAQSYQSAPAEPDPEMLKLFGQALEQGAGAVATFIDQYGEQMDPATWQAIYETVASLPEGGGAKDLITKGLSAAAGLMVPVAGAPLVGLLAPSIKKAIDSGVDTEAIRASVRGRGILTGVFIPDAPTTVEGVQDSILKWLKSEEAQQALSEQVPKDLDALIERKRAEGANASEITDLEKMKSPEGVLAEHVTALTPEYILQLNPQLQGMTEIPAGTPIILSPRSTTLREGETFSQVATRVGVPVENLLAFNQREETQFGRVFDPDRLDLGKKIYIPPQGFTPQETAGTILTPEGPQTAPGPAPVTGPGGVPGAAPVAGSTPVLPGPTTDYLAGLGLPMDALNQMAEGYVDADGKYHPPRPEELGAMLQAAQYGSSNMPGQFGAYLSSQLGDLGMMTNLYDALGLGGGIGNRGGAAATFQDIYNSLPDAPRTGPGGGNPQESTISDWRNALYAGLLAGGDRVKNLPGEPKTLDQAGTYLAQYIAPLLSSTMGPGALQVLGNMLPDLWLRYNQDRAAGSKQLWAQWLQQGGYLPSVAQ